MSLKKIYYTLLRSTWAKRMGFVSLIFPQENYDFCYCVSYIKRDNRVNINMGGTSSTQ